MKLTIDAGTYGKALECQTKQELLDAIKQEVCQETISVKVFIENRCEPGEEAGRDPAAAGGRH